LLLHWSGVVAATPPTKSQQCCFCFKSTVFQIVSNKMKFAQSGGFRRVTVIGYPKITVFIIYWLSWYTLLPANTPTCRRGHSFHTLDHICHVLKVETHTVNVRCKVKIMDILIGTVIFSNDSNHILKLLTALLRCIKI